MVTLLHYDNIPAILEIQSQVVVGHFWDTMY